MQRVPQSSHPAPHFALVLQVQEMMLGGLDSSVLDRIAKIMSYMTVQGGCRRRRLVSCMHAVKWAADQPAGRAGRMDGMLCVMLLVVYSHLLCAADLSTAALMPQRVPAPVAWLACPQAAARRS